MDTLDKIEAIYKATKMPEDDLLDQARFIAGDNEGDNDEFLEELYMNLRDEFEDSDEWLIVDTVWDGFRIFKDVTP